MMKVIVNVQLHERRVAIVEDKNLVELMIERSDQRRIVGNIYKGIVENVVSSLNAAFVEVGLQRRVFLHISDIAHFDPFADAETEEDDESFHQPLVKNYGVHIDRVLKKKQEVLVQIVKDPMGTKGARCTTQLSIPGRYLVLIAGPKHIGVSRRISERRERSRLRRIIADTKPEGFGVIIRTIARGLPAEALIQDLNGLLEQWEKIKRKAQVLPAGSLIYRDAGLIPALVRDQFSEDVQEFIIDSQDEYKKIIAYVKQVAPNLSNRIKLYNGKEPIFERLGIEKQIDKMLYRSVRLHSGGEIVIDITEALIAIDVNSSKSTKKRDYEDMILKVNLEAADEIARQLRLRDLGGIIAVDFIDLARKENSEKVEKAFSEALRNDRATKRILPMNEFGMIIITRKRIRQSITSRITEQCPVCRGVGSIYSPSTMVAYIERWLIHATGHFKGKAIMLTHPSIAEELLSDNGQRITDFSEAYGIRLVVFADVSFSPNSYRIISSETGEDITDSY
ncbi:Rne/Rng family ribonuclease [bacterium]|nr:Rne/Rng family ribonuclease [bacterium]